MRIASFLLLLTLFFAPAVQSADFSGTEVFLPIVSRVPGANGTQWRTDLVISSRHDHLPVTVEMIYFPAGAEAILLRIDLDPLQTVTFSDVVLSKFGSHSSFGTIWLGTSNPAVRIAAHARIYNTGNAAGEFGQIVQGFGIERLNKVVWLHGLNGIDGNRTNVGIGNPNNEEAHVSLSWFDKTGSFRGAAGTFEVAAWGVFLLNDIFDKTGVEYDEGLTLRIRSNVPIYAYASVVRDDTGDAYTIIGNGSDED